MIFNIFSSNNALFLDFCIEKIGLNCNIQCNLKRCGVFFQHKTINIKSFTKYTRSIISGVNAQICPGPPPHGRSAGVEQPKNRCTLT